MPEAFPLVSIITAVRNGERYLGAAIESVLQQDYPSKELILVDDGSTDNTRQVAQAYGEAVRYVYQDWAGVSAARNRGTSLARGEFIGFLDGDDLLLPGKISAQVEILAADPGLGYVHSGWQKVDADGNILSTWRPWRTSPTLDLEAWIMHWPILMAAMLFRRAWIEQAGEFDTRLPQAEDTEFLHRLVLTGCRGAWLPQVTMQYRLHGANTTQKTEEAVRCSDLVVERFFAHPDLPENVRRLEKEVRFNNLLWCAFRLYESGSLEPVVNYFQRSLAYVHTPPPLAAVLWLQQISERARGGGNWSAEKLRALFPAFRAALQMEDALWRHTQRMLEQVLESEAKKCSP